MSFAIPSVRFASLVLKTSKGKDQGTAEAVEYYNDTVPAVYQVTGNARTQINVFGLENWPERLGSSMKTLQRVMRKKPGHELVLHKDEGLDDLLKFLNSPTVTTKAYRPSQADFFTPLFNCLSNAWHPLEYGERVQGERTDPYRDLRNSFTKLVDESEIRLNPKAKPTEPFLKISRD